MNNAQSNNTIKGNYWVAYFDILGFRNQVNIAEQKGNHSILWAFDKAFDEIALHKPFCFDVVWFSDTFVFYSSEDSAEHIVCVTRDFFEQMFLLLIPLRGCLNFGRFYKDKNKNIYFGSALNEAYELAEDQDWIGYILSEKAVEKMKKCRTQGGKTDWDVLRTSYPEYDVPFHDSRKKRPACKKRLPACNIGFRSDRDYRIVTDNYFKLIDMYRYAKHNIEHDPDLSVKKRQDALESVKRKYANTGDFLLKICPQIRNNGERIPS